MKFLILLGWFFAQTALCGDMSGVQQVQTADGLVHGLGYIPPAHLKLGVTYWKLHPKSGMPFDYDLRSLGLVSPIKDQGQCGSCWAFSLTKSHESARLKAGLSPLSLSEQVMVDCDSGAWGCNGGNMDDGNWIVKNGQPLESAYPYKGYDARCQPFTKVSQPSQYVYIGQNGAAPTTAEIKAALMQYGVLSTTVSAGGNDWSSPPGGIMTECDNTGTNHMVAIAGWIHKGGNEYFIGANSWGLSFGDAGFFYIRQGCDEFASDPQSVGTFVVPGGPGPIPPHIQLPAEIDLVPGATAAIGVREEAGVTYSWTADGVQLSDVTSTIYESPVVDTVYTLTAVTAGGTASSSTKVHIISAGH